LLLACPKLVSGSIVAGLPPACWGETLTLGFTATTRAQPMVQSFVTISESKSITSGGLSAKLAVRPMEDPAEFVAIIELLRLDNR